MQTLISFKLPYAEVHPKLEAVYRIHQADHPPGFSVWSSLVESFGEGAGKIRVFVQPDFADTVRNLTREELEGLLSASATETLA